MSNQITLKDTGQCKMTISVTGIVLCTYSFVVYDKDNQQVDDGEGDNKSGEKSFDLVPTPSDLKEGRIDFTLTLSQLPDSELEVESKFKVSIEQDAAESGSASFSYTVKDDSLDEYPEIILK